MKNVGILLFDDVEVLDFAGPFEVFSVTGQREGKGYFNVFIISEKELIKAVNGLKIVPDYRLDNHPKLDILVVPGGYGARVAIKNNKLLKWVNEVSKNSEYVLSVCTGSLILAKAGLLNNLEATTHHTCYDLLQELDTTLKLKKRRFIDNGKIITAAGVSAGIDASMYLIAKIHGEDVSKETAKYIEYPYYK
ncbi:MAG: DJ-1/PfpI family protein [Bacillota bacterium]|nr:DJ-1/PfpI family protein [Bacillota bacterium]